MKTIKTIWKRFLLWIGAAAMLLSVGCAKRNATEESAMQLDMVQMVETAKENPEAPTGADAIDLYELLCAPEHCTEELVSEKGWLTVHLDADVILPDTALPIVRLESKEITMEDIRHYAEVLFDPEAKYVESSNTKGFWKLQIDELQYGIDHWDEFGEFKYDLRFYTVEEAKKGLAEWTENMEKAPESVPEIAPAFEWNTESGSSKHWLATTTSDYAHFSYLSVFDAHIHYVRDMQKTHGVLDLRKVDVAEHLTISIADAYKVAQETVARLGIDGLVCTYQAGMLSDNRDWYGYDFIFERQVRGVPVTFVNYGNDSTGREFLRITVDDAGVATLDYYAPKQIADEMTAQAALLPFEQIKAVFDRMVMVVENQTESAAWNRPGMPNLTADYYIGEIRLGLAPVEESGDTGKYLLVPAWDFIGYSSAAIDGKDQGVYNSNEKSSFLTINAVDGSIITRVI